MAENESLVLGDPYAFRWRVVCKAVRNGQSREKVAKKVERAIREGLRNARKQLAERGISLEMLLANRESPRTLNGLLNKSEGHDYVALFAQTALAAAGSGTREFLEAFVGGIWEIMSDKISHNVSGSERWPSLVDAQAFLDEVQSEIRPEVQRIAERLAADPSSMLTGKRGTNVDETDPTADMLGVSLLGIQNK